MVAFRNDVNTSIDISSVKRDITSKYLANLIIFEK